VRQPIQSLSPGTISSFKVVEISDALVHFIGGIANYNERHLQHYSKNILIGHIPYVHL
jgi:hypothetical protein